MDNIKKCKLWLTLSIGLFLLSIILFIHKLYINSVVAVFFSLSFLGFALVSSNIKQDTKNAINKFVAYIITPLSITFLGTLVYAGIHKDKNILLFSINFFIIIFAINIFFKKNNISFKKH